MKARDVRDLLMRHGFAEVETAGEHFRWFENPPPSYRRAHGVLAYARCLYYEPRQEFQIWIVGEGMAWHRASSKGHWLAPAFQGTGLSESEIEAEVGKILYQRILASAYLLVISNRIPASLQPLAEAIYADNRDRARLIALVDRLLEMGVPL